MGRPKGGCLYGFRKSLERKYSLKFCVFENGVILGANLFFYFVPRYISCTNWKYDFDKFEKLLCGLNDAQFWIVGDLNARVGNEQVVNENLLMNCPLLVPDRKSRDGVIDNKGRK